MKLDKHRLSDYSEYEFLVLLKQFWDEELTEEEEDEFVYSFNNIVEHPEKSDLIFYPSDDREDSPEGVVKEIKRWYSEHGLPCFKV